MIRFRKRAKYRTSRMGSRFKYTAEFVYIHRHIIAHELFEDSSWKYDYKKKYFTQTVWSNQSSQNASQGKNQSYYEWYIKEKLMQDNDLEVNYRVKLIYEKMT